MNVEPEYYRRQIARDEEGQRLLFQTDRHEVILTHNLEDPAWDSFASSCPGGHYEQLCAWARFKNLYGWTAVRLIALRGGEISGGALILCRHVRALGWIGYVQHGPIWNPEIPEASDVVSEGLNRWGAAGRIAYMVVNPAYFGEELSTTLPRLGFTPKPYLLPPNFLITATLLLDLNSSLERVFSSMHESTRYDVRRGMREGGRLREGGEGDLPLFRGLMVQLCERRGVPPTPPDPDFFSNLWKYLAVTGAVRLFVMECKGEPVSAAFCFAFGDTFRVWKVGWSGTCASARPNHLMWWQLIKWAKEKGFRYFDFFQIIPEHAQAIVHGREIRGPYAGVTLFKLRFGGKLTLLPQTLYKSYKPGIRLGLRFAEKTVFANGMTGRTFNWLLGGRLRAANEKGAQ